MSSQPDKNATEETQLRRGRVRRWTYLEMVGLAASFFLLIWPVINLVTSFIVPAPSSAAGVGIIKVVDKTSAKVGDRLGYEIAVTNNTGAPDVLNIVDGLPVGLTVAYATVDPSSACTVNISNNNGQYSVTCQGTGFANGAVAKLYIGATISNKADPGSTLTNQATATIGISSATSNSVSTVVQGAAFTASVPPATPPTVATVVPTLSPLPTYPTATPNVSATPTIATTNTPTTGPGTPTSTPSNTPTTGPGTPTATNAPTATTGPGTPTSTPSNTATVKPGTATATPTKVPTATPTRKPTVAGPPPSGNSSISGQVTLDGNPANNFTLRLNGGNYQNTNSNGNYDFTKLTAGNYEITLIDNTSQYVAVNGVYTDTISLSDNQNVSGINFSLITAGSAPTYTPGGPSVTAGGSATPTTVPNTPTPTTAAASGVVAGVLTVNGQPLTGGNVDLVLRGDGSNSVLATTQIDSSGHYFFSNVPATGTNQYYLVSYTNPDTTSGILALWNSNPFALANNSTFTVPSANVGDITLGNPGSGDKVISLPYTFSWTKRNSADNYSLSFFPSNGSTDGVDTGPLGNVSSFTVPSGTLAQGDYYARINFANDAGTGASNHLFHFQVVSAGSVSNATNTPTSRPVTATPTAKPATATPKPATATFTPVISGNQGSSRNVNSTATPAATSQVEATGIVVTAVPTLPPGVNSNSGGGSLPTTGGELPFLGLSLAILTLIERRVRLVFQRRRRA